MKWLDLEWVVAIYTYAYTKYISYIFENFLSNIEIIANAEYSHQLDTNFERWAPICFQYEENTNRSIAISNVLRKHFLPMPLNTTDSLAGLIDVRYPMQSHGTTLNDDDVHALSIE